MHTKIYSATTIGVNTHLVDVEVDLSNGLLQFFIVGLADIAIKESKQRISTAIKNSDIRLPRKKITVNLAPADLKKEGTTFDLPIAVGILQASEKISLTQEYINQTLFLGELSLDGTIKPIKGVLPITYDAHTLGKKRIIVSQGNTQEASLIEGIEVIGVSHITELIGYLKGAITIEPTQSHARNIHASQRDKTHDFKDVKGQQQAKRALQISAAGHHNILFVGSPGSGKTMLAQRITSIMPPMSFNDILETSKVYSITGRLRSTPLITERPFRSPHHTISQAGLVGGGSFPQPGEISLAHNGILFLDELTEFKRDTLEVLRQPIEYKTVHISRAQHSVSFPASFLLVGALNPCPCGFLGDAQRHCSCSDYQITRYMNKLSGPLLDRIDLQISVSSLKYEVIHSKADKPLSSDKLYKGVMRAYHAQQKRFNDDVYNAHMAPQDIEKYCILTDDAQELVKKAFNKLYLTMRGYHKLLKVSRTIADIEGSDIIQKAHIKEALFYRSLDHLKEKERV
jgi:magnesium chelatase family protein